MLQQKARAIKALILDVDGILTDGLLYYGNNGLELKSFDIQDGLGIHLLHKAQINIGIISGRSSDAVVQRMKELHIQDVYLGQTEKLNAFYELQKKWLLEPTQIAYMGDDLPDLPVLKRVGFSATVPEAPSIIKETVDYITKKSAGRGAVREVAELLLNAQDKLQPMVQSYLG